MDYNISFRELAILQKENLTNMPEVTLEMLEESSKMVKAASKMNSKKKIQEILIIVSNFKPALNFHDFNFIRRALYRNQITVNDIPSDVLKDYNLWMKK